MGGIGDVLSLVLHVLTFAILARALMSWFPQSPDNPLVRVLWQITEPILSPLRQIIPRLGLVDLTPMIAIILLQVIANVLSAA